VAQKEEAALMVVRATLTHRPVGVSSSDAMVALSIGDAAAMGSQDGIVLAALEIREEKVFM
jgi:hypothetical protein